MEVAFFVVAIIGLLALSASSGSASTPQQQQYQQYQTGPPQTWAPTPTPAFGAPMVPSQAANLGAPIMSGAAAIGTTIQAQSVSNSGGGPPSGVAVAAAAGIAIVGSIVASLLQAHQARLKGATNENNAVDQYVPVFDSFVSNLVAAWNGGQATAAEVAQAAQQFDKAIYNALRSLVGSPGTAWNDSIGMSGQCNSSCTVGCCVYFGDLGPVLNNISYVLGFPTGKWGQGDPRISGRTITVPKVYPSKYSSYTRALYTITLK
jgi:hypothetical protein